jgi:hypothetical protein
MTATAPGSRVEASGRAGVLPLVTALLLALSGLFALPGALLTQEYYSNSWAVAALAGPASVLPTLVLVAAAAARGSRLLLLVASGVTALHLVGLIALATAAASGPENPLVFLSGPIQLGLALVGLALAWWDTSRTERHPGIALTVVVLAPVLGLLVDVSHIDGSSWYIIGVGILVLQQLPAILAVPAAGLVCLPGRGARIGGATLIGIAGLSLLCTGPVLDPAAQPPALRLGAIAAALLCAVIAAGLASPAEAVVGSDDVEPGDVPSGRAMVDAAPPSDAVPVAPPSDTAPTAPPSDARPGAPGGTLPVAALTVLVLTVALNVPELFTHGPGIQPGGGGPLLLIGFLVDAALPAALTLTAGAATLGSRGALGVASACLGVLAILLLVSRTAAGGTVTVHEALPFVALGLSLALAWMGTARIGPGGTALRWTAVIPLILAASPLMVLTDPSAMAYVGDPTFVDQRLLGDVLPGAVPVIAAALLGFPRHGTRLAATVPLAVLALTSVVMLLDDSSFLAELNLLRMGGYGFASVLAVASVLPQRAAVRP